MGSEEWQEDAEAGAEDACRGQRCVAGNEVLEVMGSQMQGHWTAGRIRPFLELKEGEEEGRVPSTGEA